MQPEGAPQQQPHQNGGEEGQEECSICLDALHPNEAHTVFHLHEGQPHQHSFHTTCIAPVAQAHHPRCPNCRRDITADERRKIEREQRILNNPELDRRVRWAWLKYATAQGIRVGSVGIGFLWGAANICTFANGPASFRRFNTGWGNLLVYLMRTYGMQVALAGVGYAEMIERQWFPDQF